MRSIKTMYNLLIVSTMFVGFVFSLAIFIGPKPVFADGTLSLVASAGGFSVDSKARLGQTIALSYKIVFSGTGSIVQLAVTDNGILVHCPVIATEDGASVTCTGSYKVTAADVANGSINHTATASVIVNNSAARNETSVSSGPSTYSIQTTSQSVPAAALNILGQASGTFQGTGDKLGFTFTVISTGQQRLSGIGVTNSPTFGVTCKTTTIASGASTTCTGTYRASSTDNENGKVVINSFATAKSPSGKTIKSQTITNSVTKSKAPAQDATDGSGIEASTLPQTTATRGTIDDLLNIVFGIIGGIAVLVVAVGGLRYILANGDANAIAQAKNTILYAIIGLVVAISGFSIVTFVVSNLQ